MSNERNQKPSTREEAEAAVRTLIAGLEIIQIEKAC